ncbi:putative ribonuclease H-like domain-containing protein [Tanacetum coccineum]
MPTDPQYIPTIIKPSTSQPQKKQRSRRPKRKDTEVPQPSGPTTNVTDEAIYEDMDDSLERAATTATSLDAEQDRGNINKTQPKATLNEPSSLGTSSGSGPKRQDTMGDTITRTRLKNASKTSNDSLLAGVNTPQTQAQEITSLKLRVKKLEKKRGSRTHKLKRLYKVGRSARVISSDEASLDDIIFGSTKKSLCTEFEKVMYKKFQMSSMGELTFFLGLQVKQKEDGIFISQDKYVTEILKKFSFTYVKTASTHMETQKLLLKDEDGKEVDVHLYRSIIGSLMYLTSSRPDIMFAVKSVNGYVQLQALVDGKKIIITEASVRRDLQLNDEEGTDYLPNATIFEELTRMGYEILSQKLTFYKALFSP